MAWERDKTPRHWTGFTLIAAAMLLAMPLWNVWAPAMPDYPAHLASFALIDQSTFHHGARRASGLYHLQWSFVPNLASEILVPLSERVVRARVAVATAKRCFRPSVTSGRTPLSYVYQVS